MRASLRGRIWLGTAVVGLSVMTVLVGIAIYYFVASFLAGWQAQPGAAGAQTMVTSVAAVAQETAVFPTQTPPSLTRVSGAADQVLPAGHDEDLPEDASEVESTPPPVSTAYLIIPSLDVSQEITHVPIVAGEWVIDELGSQIGLLDSTGTHPGDDLAMTFIGHVTRPWPEIAGPFADLILLEHGEEVIYRANGTDYVYQVERIFRADPRAVDLLYVPNGDKIVLVTCSGWDFIDRAYAERLVTRAVLVRTEPSSS